MNDEGLEPGAMLPGLLSTNGNSPLALLVLLDLLVDL